VDLVKVDDVRPEAPQGLLGGALDVRSARVVRDARDDAALRGEEHLPPESGRLGEGFSEELLGEAVPSVDVRVVEEPDPSRERRLDELADAPRLAFRE